MNEVAASVSLIEWVVAVLATALTASVGHLHIRLAGMETELKRAMERAESDAKREIELVRQRSDELRNIVQREMLPRADFQLWCAESRDERKAMEQRLMDAILEGRVRRVG